MKHEIGRIDMKGDAEVRAWWIASNGGNARGMSGEAWVRVIAGRHGHESMAGNHERGTLSCRWVIGPYIHHHIPPHTAFSEDSCLFIILIPHRITPQ